MNIVVYRDELVLSTERAPHLFCSDHFVWVQSICPVRNPCEFSLVLDFTRIVGFKSKRVSVSAPMCEDKTFKGTFLLHDILESRICGFSCRHRSLDTSRSCIDRKSFCVLCETLFCVVLLCSRPKTLQFQSCTEVLCVVSQPWDVA